MLAQPLYINRMASVHPVFKRKLQWKDSDWATDKQFIASEPDYKEIIPNPSLRRRMSRIIRMGVAAGLQCLQGSVQPDAILTATGLGCLADTEKFMNNLLDMDEELLPPTAFIQSTFNTIGAQIALLTGNHCYNNTYTHRGFSFESALLDASLLIQEGEADCILTGASDELTPTLYNILNYFACKERLPAGEGAAFFLLGREATDSSFAILQDIEMMNGSFSEDEIREKIEEILSKHFISDVQVLYPKAFKQYCGEYPTATAFAVWYACTYPEQPYSLLYNSFLDNNSFILLKHI